MPLWKPSLSSTSMILASRMTCRCTLRSEVRSTCSIWRNSSGNARTTTMPDCGDTAMLRSITAALLLLLPSVAAATISLQPNDTPPITSPLLLLDAALSGRPINVHKVPVNSTQ